MDVLSVHHLSYVYLSCLVRPCMIRYFSLVLGGDVIIDVERHQHFGTCSVLADFVSSRRLLIPKIFETS